MPLIYESTTRKNSKKLPEQIFIEKLRSWLDSSLNDQDQAFEAFKRILVNYLNKNEHLELSDLNLTDLPEVISQLDHITKLSISEDNIAKLFAQISKIKNIKTFNFGLNTYRFNNHLMRRILNSQSPEKNFIDSLNKWVSRQRNKTNAQEASKRILLNYLTKQSELDLSNLGLESLPDSISQLNHLKDLKLSRNYLKEISTSIFKLTNLKSLDLDSNSIKTVSQDIKKLVNLEILNIKGNPISLIFDDLFNLPKLREFHLGSNDYIRKNLKKFKFYIFNRCVHYEKIKIFIHEPSNAISSQLPIGNSQISSQPPLNFFDQPLKKNDEESFLNDLLHFANNPKIPYSPLELSNFLKQADDDSDENYNGGNYLYKSLKKFVLHSKSFLTSDNTLKTKLAQELIDIICNIYEKRNDLNFMKFVNIFCKDSLNNCSDRNSFFIFYLANYSKRKTSSEINSLSLQQQFQYLKNQTLFNYFMELAHDRVKELKVNLPNFSEDIEVCLNYLRVFNFKFGIALNLEMPSINSQQHFANNRSNLLEDGEQSVFKPQKKEIDNFAEITKDYSTDNFSSLNNIIANQLAKIYKSEPYLKELHFIDSSQLDTIEENITSKYQDQLKKIEENEEINTLDYIEFNKNLLENLESEKIQEFTKYFLTALEQLQANFQQTTQIPAMQPQTTHKIFHPCLVTCPLESSRC